MSRHDISDVQWAVIAPLIPKQKLGPGRKRNDDRQTLNGILFVLKTGCTWADVPRVHGSPAPVGDASALGPTAPGSTYGARWHIIGLSV